MLTRGVVPQRDRRAGRDRRVDQRRRAPAGHRRPARRRADARTTSTASAPTCRCWSTCSRPGRFLMEDFHRAGGLLAVLREVAGPARPGRAHGHRRAAGRLPRRRADLGPRGDPVRARAVAADAGIAVLYGNLAPDGAVIKPAAASPAPAAAPRPGAWCSTRSRTCTPASTTRTSTSTPTRCWCCAAAARKGYPGMPEVANMPLPTKLLEQGVRDMVRICDGRMSGTAYGTVVLHVAPEAAAGGPLAWCAPATSIVLDVAEPAARRRRRRTRSWPRATPDAADGAALRRPGARLGAALRRARAAGRHRRRPRLPRRLQRRRRSPASRTESRPTG